MAVDVTFWGVRGTFPCPLPSHMTFGGNTACVEVNLDGRIIILDCGTGLRGLGKKLADHGPQRATILLSHLHLDHIAGFPYFGPAFRPEFGFRVLCGRRDGAPPVRKVLAGQMEPPLFPVPLRELQASMAFEDFRPGDSLELEGGIDVVTAPLNHPDGSVGFRIEYAGRVVAYVTDTEHVPGRRDPNVLKLIDGADLVIYDATYTDEEWASRVGWGHSTWSEGVRLCSQAGAKRLALFHHEPDHDDTFVAALEREAQKAWGGVFAAREGLTVTLGD